MVEYSSLRGRLSVSRRVLLGFHPDCYVVLTTLLRSQAVPSPPGILSLLYRNPSKPTSVLPTRNG